MKKNVTEKIPRIASVPKVPPQRALVVGVSQYPAPISKLPAVAADVREMAKLLSSKEGAFFGRGVKVLTERNAKRIPVQSALREAFEGARATETIFVYLAGHGSDEGGNYYFCPYDAKPGRMAETGISLSDIKTMFDKTASKRVFLWMDFCYSGGILPRGIKPPDIAAIKRAIGVVSGQGKIIVAACTSEQKAYESSAIGHGYFTHALIRGLKGEAAVNGEVTALNLYEFIDRQVANNKQQPVFLGQGEGRMVLMHHPGRVASAPVAPTPKATKKASPAPVTRIGSINSSGSLLLLDGQVYTAREVKDNNDGNIEVQVISKNGDEAATLLGLRSGPYNNNHRKVKFAYANRAFTAQVNDVSSTTASGRTTWTITLQPVQEQGSWSLMGGYGDLTADGIAEKRARFLLLGDKDTSRTQNDRFLLSTIQGPLKDLGISESIFKNIGKGTKSPSLTALKEARLRAVYYLVAGGVCDDVLELKLGPVRSGKLSIRFRGRRKAQYSNSAPMNFS